VDKRRHGLLLFSLITLCFLIASDFPLMRIDSCGHDLSVCVTAKPAVICGVAITSIAVLFMRQETVAQAIDRDLPQGRHGIG
jgi:hypothetical protein